MRALPVNGFMYEKSRLFDPTVAVDYITIMIDAQYVAASHAAPVYAPAVDEKCAVVQCMAEVIVDAFVQVLVSGYAKNGSEVAAGLFN
jgi:hypothetical protein